MTTGSVPSYSATPTTTRAATPPGRQWRAPPVVRTGIVSVASVFRRVRDQTGGGETIKTKQRIIIVINISGKCVQKSQGSNRRRGNNKDKTKNNNSNKYQWQVCSEESGIKQEEGKQ